MVVFYDMYLSNKPPFKTSGSSAPPINILFTRWRASPFNVPSSLDFSKIDSLSFRNSPKDPFRSCVCRMCGSEQGGCGFWGLVGDSWRPPQSQVRTSSTYRQTREDKPGQLNQNRTAQLIHCVSQRPHVGTSGILLRTLHL